MLVVVLDGWEGSIKIHSLFIKRWIVKVWILNHNATNYYWIIELNLKSDGTYWNSCGHLTAISTLSNNSVNKFLRKNLWAMSKENPLVKNSPNITIDHQSTNRITNKGHGK